jgi:hypothetical protein
MIDSLGMEHPTGTNIRIYNADEKKWYMAWIDKNNRRLAPFTALNDSGTIVMDGTNAKGRHIKNIFLILRRMNLTGNRNGHLITEIHGWKLPGFIVKGISSCQHKIKDLNSYIFLRYF